MSDPTISAAAKAAAMNEIREEHIAETGTDEERAKNHESGHFVQQAINESTAQLQQRACELEAERDEVSEYLWPNQTGLPNKHRNQLIAIQTREKLLTRKADVSAKLSQTQEHDIERLEGKLRLAMKAVRAMHLASLQNGNTKESSEIIWEGTRAYKAVMEDYAGENIDV